MKICIYCFTVVCFLMAVSCGSTWRINGNRMTVVSVKSDSISVPSISVYVPIDTMHYEK